MVKHIFGAKSSPSVINLCLKKTAEMGGEQSPEVANVEVKETCTLTT